MKRSFSLSVIVLLTFLVACRTSGAEMADQVIEPANISAVELVFDDDIVTVNASGFLPDSCTTILESTQTITDNSIEIALTTVRPADAICSQVLEEFSEPIPIDVTELPNGEYTVTVNGVVAAEPVVLGDEAMP